jgi:hypothetical protein
MRTNSIELFILSKLLQIYKIDLKVLTIQEASMNTQLTEVQQSLYQEIQGMCFTLLDNSLLPKWVTRETERLLSTIDDILKSKSVVSDKFRLILIPFCVKVTTMFTDHRT